MTTSLPDNVDATYADDPLRPSVKVHQQHHETIHQWINGHLAAGHSAAFIAVLDQAENFDGLTVEAVLAEIAATFVRQGQVYDRIVDHGDAANYVRPDVPGRVLWRGAAEPVNAIDGDDWMKFLATTT